MTATPEVLDEQRKALSAKLDSLKGLIDQNGAAAVAIREEVQTDLGEIKQTIDALRRGAVQGAQGPQGEADWYAQVSERAVKANPGAYHVNDRGAVQLFHHDAQKGVGSYGLLDDPNPRDDAQRHLQRTYEDWAMTRSLLALCEGGETETPKLDWQLQRAAMGMSGQVARIFSDTANLGAEWMPKAVSPELEREVLAQLGIIGMFPERAHPGGTLTLPYQTGHLQAFNKEIPAANDRTWDRLSEFGTDSDDIKALSDFVGAQVDRDAGEDSIIPVLPQIREDLARALAFADDNRLFNGDTTGAQDLLVDWNVRGHLAYRVNDATHQLRQWDGLRKKALAGGALSSTDMGGTPTFAGMAALWNLMGIEQLMDSTGGTRAVICVTPEFFFETMLFWTEFQGWDAVGPFAALLTGMIGGQSPISLPNQVGYLAGRFPVVLAYTLTGDTNASGVFDNVTTTKRQICVVDRTRYERWNRRGATVSTKVEIRNDQLTVVARKRGTFREKALGTGQYGAVLGYNLP